MLLLSRSKRQGGAALHSAPGGIKKVRCHVLLFAKNLSARLSNSPRPHFAMDRLCDSLFGFRIDCRSLLSNSCFCQCTQIRAVHIFKGVSRGKFCSLQDWAFWSRLRQVRCPAAPGSESAMPIEWGAGLREADTYSAQRLQISNKSVLVAMLLAANVIVFAGVPCPYGLEISGV